MMFNQEFIESLSVSSLRRCKLLYVYAILFTPILFLNVIPFPKTNNLLAVVILLYLLILLIIAIFSMFRVAPQVNKVLKIPGGLMLPEGRVSKVVSTTLVILFFIWFLGLPSVVIYWINPQILQSNTDGTGWGWAIFSLEAGPTEEMWRWAFSLSLFFLGTHYLARIPQQILLGTALLISCILFGVGHIGEFSGHNWLTWFVISLSGLLLIFFAYWGRSFWIVVLAHSLYDFIIFLGVIPMLWWTIMVVPWGVIAFFYYRWRRSVVLTEWSEPTDRDNRLSS